MPCADTVADGYIRLKKGCFVNVACSRSGYLQLQPKKRQGWDMRKTQKRQIEDTIRQMEKAHDEMKRYMEKGIAAQVEELLADCQNAAITIGTLIEGTEGEGHPAVTVLEGYCDLVYQIHESLMSDESVKTVNANKIYKSLRQKLIKATNSIRNDIKIRKEAVFLPYKASMWDSLESVWKAADADPDCDAYVIPIPYFDKNPDGSFREMHYEGGQYPDYVTVTRYDSFDFGKHMPDVIYIHNGYDDWNLVTSVHPDFYSRNLKKYTEQLVYIPYFVLGEIDPDNEQAVEGVKHFCFMPGIINADKVIVESENIKEIYVREYLKSAKKYGLMGKNLDRKFLEKKFLGIGSPKIDKVLKTKKEDLEIPTEWLKVIEKPDGSWKKIFFYNTSVGALLQHSEKMLQKMKSVFGIFKENREEAALLWRPHPLIQATIESMRPQLRKEYKELKDRYIDEGWGIYDDSADLDRAVVLSDAYYGDYSSVVQIYRKTNKKIFIQNANTLDVREIVSDQNGTYILSSDTQSLFQYSASSKMLRLCGVIGEGTMQAYICAASYKNKIYIPPYNGDDIEVYDIDKRRFYKIPLMQSRGKRLRSGYKICFENQGKLYLLGEDYTETLIVDLQNETVQAFSDWFDGFKREYGCEAGIYTHKSVCIVDDCFWVPMCYDNVLLQYDMRNHEYYFWNVGKKKIQYATINFDGHFFWLTGNQKIIVRWEKESDSVKEYEAFPEGFKSFSDKLSWDSLFVCGCLLKGSLYYAPMASNMLIRFNVVEEKMECILKIEDSHIFLNMTKVNDNVLYLGEREDDLSMCQSYVIDVDGKYRKYSVHTGERDDVGILADCVVQKTEMMENHPKFLETVLNRLSDI